MTPRDTLLEVFCLVDDQLQDLDLEPLRRRGPKPALSDSEGITLELVGELWKLDTDKDLFRFFRPYHRREVPALAGLSRTTFARQAANLWRVKQLIQQRLAGALAEGDPIWLVDSLPIDACPFARARGGDASGAVLSEEQGPRPAEVGPAQRGAVQDRDGQRPAGGAI